MMYLHLPPNLLPNFHHLRSLRSYSDSQRMQRASLFSVRTMLFVSYVKKVAIFKLENKETEYQIKAKYEVPTTFANNS